MSKLLVSVRNREEALAAWKGGADIIDMKEPSRGSLGRVDDRVLEQVLASLPASAKLSAAQGELVEGHSLPDTERIQFFKWGLAGLDDDGSWKERLCALQPQLQMQAPTCRMIPVAYADWRRAGSPSPKDVCQFVVSRGGMGLLLDTWKKDGGALLDWLSHSDIMEIRKVCLRHDAPFALAGSLSLDSIRSLGALAPDWFAVRGAACVGGDRNAAIDVDAVRQLAEACGTATEGSNFESRQNPPRKMR